MRLLILQDVIAGTVNTVLCEPAQILLAALEKEKQAVNITQT